MNTYFAVNSVLTISSIVVLQRLKNIFHFFFTKFLQRDSNAVKTVFRFKNFLSQKYPSFPNFAFEPKELKNCVSETVLVSVHGEIIGVTDFSELRVPDCKFYIFFSWKILELTVLYRRGVFLSHSKNDTNTLNTYELTIAYLDVLN